MGFKKIFIIGLSIFLFGLSSVFATSTSLNENTMNLLSSKFPKQILSSYFDSGTIMKLNKACQLLDNKEKIIKVLNTKLKKAVTKKEKVDILLKGLYLYECVSDKYKKEINSSIKQLNNIDTYTGQNLKEEQLLNIVTYYLSSGGWNEIFSRRIINDNLRKFIRQKIHSIIDEVDTFDKPTKEIIISTGEIEEEFKPIKFIIKRNNNLEGFYTMFDDVYTDSDIKPSEVVKISSNFGKRYLTHSWEYHFGYDITLLNKQADVRYNCQFKPSYRHNVARQDYLKWQKYFDKDICKTDISKLPNYKEKYVIYTKINLKQLYKNGGECYIARHIPRNGKNRLVGFGNILVCKLSKKDNVWTIIGHNDNVIDKILESKYVSRIPMNSTGYVKVDGLLASFYQKNYPTFNKYKHNFDGLRLVNYLTNVGLYRFDLYKVNFKKLINDGYEIMLVKYGTTGHSFGEHIHWGILLKNGIYVSPLTDQQIWYKLLKQLFNDNNIGEENYYYSVYTLTYKGKNAERIQ